MKSQPVGNQHPLGTNQPAHAEAKPIGSGVFRGQIEQVVSSADCRSADSVSDQNANISAIREEIRDDGAAGTSPSSVNQPAPILELEEQLFVALAARGHLRIGQFIENAIFNAGLGFCDPTDRSGEWFSNNLPSLSDEELVQACERYAFEGERA